MDVKILVAHHKRSIIIKDDVYIPIQVGKEISNIDLDIIGDNTGDNISIKNPIYCEMTAIYWGWKNLTADYIGLCHYRRYFTYKRKRIVHRVLDFLRYYKAKCIGNILTPGANYIKNSQISIKDDELYKFEVRSFSKSVGAVLKDRKYDMVVPLPYLFSCRNVRQFFEVLGQDHISLICEIVLEMSPDLYPFLKKTLASNKLYAANMFIMKSELYKKYCEMIFPILLEHEKRTLEKGWCIDLVSEKCYSRLSGYLAEFLTSAYIEKLKANKNSILYVNTMFYNGRT